MHKLLRTFVASCAIVVFLAATALGAHTNFKATLTGIQEVPSITTNATGTAAITYTGAGGVVYSVTVTGLSGNITAAHFHLGAQGISGPVVQAITFTGTTSTGTWATIPDSLVAALFAGKLYLNVHTAANPGGEIRGQVILSSGTALTATLEGSQENPAVSTTARGTATLSLSSVGGAGLAYSLTVNGLSGTMTGAHFHRGGIGTNGPVIKNILTDFVGNTATGVWRTTGTGALADSDIVSLLTGGLYLNVHTATNPGGEIRGQLNVSGGFGFQATIDSSQEVPVTTSGAKGTATLVLTEYGLVYSITVTGLTGNITASHFHNAAAGVNGGVVRNLTFVNNTSTGVWKSNDAQPFTAALLRELLAGNIYINVHTAANPGGEIRGQVLLKNGSGLSARLDGKAEVPSLTHTATGTAWLTATPTGVAYELTVNGLSAPITAAHFHRAAIGINGPVVRAITSTFSGNRASGVWGTSDPTEPFTDSLRTALVAGQLYLNVHTSTNPGGELRGQVFVDAGTGFSAKLTGQQENPPLSHAATGTGNFTLTRGGLYYNISFEGLSAPATAAHFHLGYPGQNGPVMFNIFPTLNGNNITGYWPSASLADSLIVALMTGRIYVNVHTAANPGGEIRGQLFPSEGTGLTALLEGAQENPPVSTSARGTGVAQLTDAGVTYHATVDGLSGAITVAHFHNAAVGVNGPVVRNHTYSGNTTFGAWRSTDSQSLTNALTRELLANNIYFNVHTATNPGGEVRGQARTGSLVLTSVSPVSSVVPEAFSISQNYPNPFNPTTTMRLEIPSATRVQLTIFNILGKEIETLVNKEMTAGSYDVQWDAAKFASGTYFYKITAGNFVETKKMIFMK